MFAVDHALRRAVEAGRAPELDRRRAGDVPADPDLFVAGRRGDPRDRGRRGVVAESEAAGLTDVAGLVRARAGDRCRRRCRARHTVADVQPTRPDMASVPENATWTGLRYQPFASVGRLGRRAGDDRRRLVDLDRLAGASLGGALRHEAVRAWSPRVGAEGLVDAVPSNGGPRGVHRPVDRHRARVPRAVAFRESRGVALDADLSRRLRREPGEDERRDQECAPHASVSRRRWPISPRLPAAATSSASAARRASAVPSGALRSITRRGASTEAGIAVAPKLRGRRCERVCFGRRSAGRRRFARSPASLRGRAAGAAGAGGGWVAGPLAGAGAGGAAVGAGAGGGGAGAGSAA